VGWVDLWQGILIYDVLLDNDSLRYIPLPLPALPNVVFRSLFGTLLSSMVASKSSG